MREQELFFIWEKSIPVKKKNGKCRNSEASGLYCILKRKEARVAEAKCGRQKVGNEIRGNRC